MTVSSIRCALQAALLGAITSNLRAVTVTILNNELILYFYYENQPTDEEVEISEIVASEIMSDFINISIEVKRIVSSTSEKIPGEGIWVYHKKE